VAIACKFGLDGNPGILPKWYAIVVVCGICVYVAGFAWSWGPLGWLVPSEIFPLEVRSAAQSMNVSVNMIFTFAIAQIFTAMLCHMKFGLFIFFAFFVIVMSTFIYKLLPETKGVPIEEMHVVWQSHPYWKKFVKPADANTTCVSSFFFCLFFSVNYCYILLFLIFLVGTNFSTVYINLLYYCLLIFPKECEE